MHCVYFSLLTKHLSYVGQCILKQFSYSDLWTVRWYCFCS